MGNNAPRPVAVGRDCDLQVVVGHILGELLGPFHEGRPVSIAVDGAVVVDVLQLPALVQPVEVVVVQRRRPSWYSRRMLKVGLVTAARTPRAAATPWTNWVFPAPRSPSSTITSPACRYGASVAANCLVASGVEVVRWYVSPFAMPLS